MLIKATRAEDGQTVWVNAEKIDGVRYVSDKPIDKPKPKARKKNANAK